MGGEEQWDLEYNIVHDCCGLDVNAYFDNMTILTRKIFEDNFKKIVKEIEIHAGFKFHIAYQVLGRFILLLGAKITEELRDLIIEATDWSREEDLWDAELEHERKFRLNDLKEKIERYSPGKCDPIEEDLVLYPELIRFHRQYQPPKRKFRDIKKYQ